MSPVLLCVRYSLQTLLEQISRDLLFECLAQSKKDKAQKISKELEEKRSKILHATSDRVNQMPTTVTPYEILKVSGPTPKSGGPMGRALITSPSQVLSIKAQRQFAKCCGYVARPPSVPIEAHHQSSPALFAPLLQNAHAPHPHFTYPPQNWCRNC